MADHDLTRLLVAAFRPHVLRRLTLHGIDPPDRFDQAIDEGERWLASELEALFALPFASQPRGPLEVFQEAMVFPTRALEAAGASPTPRDPVARHALPGDVFDLAPASSRDLGDEVWEAHLRWGAEKAAALRGD